jgi:hypothetical protein
MAWWRDLYGGTEEERARFFDRFEAGIDRALRLRGLERPIVDIGARRSVGFRRYVMGR